jgi:hypothetical protein
MGRVSAGQDDSEGEVVDIAGERKRRRGIEQGRVVTNIPACFGRYLCAEADDLGVTPSTVARMMLIEALKARGLTVKGLEQQYPPAPFPNTRNKRKAPPTSEEERAAIFAEA